jgi:hypothetical protein
LTTQVSVPEGSVSIDPNTNLAYLKVDRQSGEGDVVGFIVGVQDPSGLVKTFRQNLTVNQLETRNLVVNYTDAAFDDVISVTVTPIFRNNATGQEIIGQPISQPVKNKTAFKLPSGLIGHWKMDEGWGDSKSNLGGTLLSGSTSTFDLSNKKVGTASASFSGSSTGYDNVPTASSLDDTSFTIVAWIYPKDVTQASLSKIAEKRSSGPGFRLAYDSITLKWQFRTYNQNGQSNTRAIAPTTPFLNSWHFVAASYDATMMSLYYDAATPDSSPPAITMTADPSTNFKIGDSFLGNIDEVMYFDRSLTSQEIQDIRTKYK